MADGAFASASAATARFNLLDIFQPELELIDRQGLGPATEPVRAFTEVDCVVATSTPFQ